MKTVKEFLEELSTGLNPDTYLEKFKVEKSVRAMEELRNQKGGYSRATTRILSLDIYAIQLHYGEVLKNTTKVLSEELSAAINRDFVRKHPTVDRLEVSYPQVTSFHSHDSGGYIRVYAHCLLLVTRESPMYTGEFIYGFLKGYEGFKPVDLIAKAVEVPEWGV